MGKRLGEGVRIIYGVRVVCGVIRYSQTVQSFVKMACQVFPILSVCDADTDVSKYVNSFQMHCLLIQAFTIYINPFTLRAPLESNVCYSHTFENNFGIKQKFPKYLKGTSFLTSC